MCLPRYTHIIIMLAQGCFGGLAGGWRPVGALHCGCCGPVGHAGSMALRCSRLLRGGRPGREAVEALLGGQGWLCMHQTVRPDACLPPLVSGEDLLIDEKPGRAAAQALHGWMDFCMHCVSLGRRSAVRNQHLARPCRRVHVTKSQPKFCAPAWPHPEELQAAALSPALGEGLARARARWMLARAALASASSSMSSSATGWRAGPNPGSAAACAALPPASVLACARGACC